VESGDRTVVGLNRYVTDEAGQPENLLRVDPQVQKKQIESLSARKAGRDRGAVDRTLDRLRTAAAGSDNLMDPIVECVKADATLGEICDVLRDVFGEYQEKVVI
jgi:methylmalonyl-CoA mutase N-terminal domain/subunit